jgi:hypothetical protein
VHHRAASYTAAFTVGTAGLLYLLASPDLFEIFPPDARKALRGVVAYFLLSGLCLTVLYGAKTLGRSYERSLARGPAVLIILMRVLLLPYAFFSGLVLAVNRIVVREAPWDKVEEGILLGAIPLAWERKRLLDEGAGAILNFCFEFPRGEGWAGSMGIVERYEPFLDGVAPAKDQLLDAVAWVREMRDEGKTVFVHCAQGHGRSAVALAAYLILTGKAPDPVAARAMLKSVRPGVRLRADSMALLSTLETGHKGEE